MAILFGEDARDIQVPQTNSYGRRLSCVRQLAIDGACDVALDEDGQIACVAARNAMVILDLQDPADPRIIGQLAVCGSGRQIERQGNLACMTARAEGLFIIDVGNPRQPRLLCHYDTIELATGVYIKDNYCFIACRHMGVEIIDISDPMQPKHISSILAGEAQSVFVSGQYLYVGAWVEREVMIFDITDPARPEKCGSCLLDGYGDGLFVRQDICFAATGHHARRLHNRWKYLDYDFVVAEMFEDGYGCGHGLELFDVTDTDNPSLLSRLKAPPQFLSNNDLWDVSVQDGYAYWADAYAGMFVINVTNPHKPAYEGYYRFPVSPGQTYRAQPSIQQPCGPVNGLAVGCGHLYLASVNFGIHVIAFEPAKPISPARQPSASTIEGWKDKSAGSDSAKDGLEMTRSIESPNQIPPAQMVFRTDGQVHGIDFHDSSILVAAGMASLFVLDAASCTVRHHVHTHGICMDVKYYQDRILMAEGSAGLSVWQLSPAGPICTARAETPETARQIVVYDELAIAVLQIGVNRVQFWDISDIESPSLLASFQEGGNLYYKNIMQGLYQHRYAVVAPLKPSTSFYNLEDRNNIYRESSDMRTMCPLEDGMALYRGKLLTVMAGKLYYDGVELFFGTDGPELKGWPSIIGDELFIINRHNGLIQLYNIQDINHPVYIGQIDTGGHPEKIVYFDNALWIACGHRGLLRISR